MQTQMHVAQACPHVSQHDQQERQLASLSQQVLGHVSPPASRPRSA